MWQGSEERRRRGRPLTPGTWKGAEVLGNEGAGGEGTPNSPGLRNGGSQRIGHKWVSHVASFLAASTPSKFLHCSPDPLNK